VICPHQFDELPIAALPEAAAEFAPGECCAPIDPLSLPETLRCPRVADGSTLPAAFGELAGFAAAPAVPEAGLDSTWAAALPVTEDAFESILPAASFAVEVAFESALPAASLAAEVAFESALPAARFTACASGELTVPFRPPCE
jgi:hypothetical protein